MRFGKKFILSLSWLTVAVIISAVLGLIAGEAPPRETTGQQASATAQLLLMGFAGFLPIVMAILVWFGRPRWLYRTTKTKASKKLKFRAVTTPGLIHEYSTHVAGLTAILADIFSREFDVREERRQKELHLEIILYAILVVKRSLPLGYAPLPNKLHLAVIEDIASSEVPHKIRLELMQAHRRSVSEFGDLPSSSGSEGGLGGTFLWEYSKHLYGFATGNEPRHDVQAIMLIVKGLSDLSRELQVDEFIKTLDLVR